MMNFKKWVFLFLVIVMTVSVIGQTSRPGIPKRQLNFENLTKDQKEMEWGAITSEPGYQWIKKPFTPAYHSSFGFVIPVKWYSKDQNARSETFFDHIGGLWKKNAPLTSVWPTLSEKQRNYVQNNEKGGVLFEGYPMAEEGRNVVNYAVTVYAVSEVDTRKMVEAYLEFLDSQTHLELERTKEKLILTRKEILKAHETIIQFGKKLESLKSQRPKDTYYIDADKAYPEYLEFDRLVRMIEIDIIGIEARSEMTRKVRSDPKVTDPNTLLSLDRMLVEQGIELTGALAKKGAAEKGRSRAKENFNILRAIEELQTSQTKLWEDLQVAQKTARDLEETLENPPETMRPVEVLYSPSLYPIKFKEDPAKKPGS
jgi:hypothetical protein